MTEYITICCNVEMKSIEHAWHCVPLQSFKYVWCVLKTPFTLFLSPNVQNNLHPEGFTIFQITWVLSRNFMLLNVQKLYYLS